jgi:FAD/FMN-containing dehydrogenase
VRPLGSGHSSSGLCATDGVLVSLERWSGVESVDPTSGCVTVRAGSVLHDLGAGLLGHGLALENLGDIDRQTLAGALATGTHGTGRALGNLASRVRGLRLVTATGDVRTLDAAQPELAGARVSLGALGVVSAVTLQALPAYRLHERVRRISLAEVLATFASEAARHRHFECFYFPRHDFAEAKSLDPTVADPESVEGREGERIGWSADILPSVRELKFHEMEYSVPEASGVACFGALAARLRERHLRRGVGRSRSARSPPTTRGCRPPMAARPARSRCIRMAASRMRRSSPTSSRSSGSTAAGRTGASGIAATRAASRRSIRAGRTSSR